ncbi:hypothetical protein F4782DRAFT_545043 [Xylaria castorea]|nr:hypothetical protein F4782DRAFT_545043 [Xylaria castorea]
MNTNITQIKRYQIDKLVGGSANSINAISTLPEALELEVSRKVNHSKILEGLFTVASVPDHRVRAIRSAVDKLDKATWEDVEKEMAEEKGLTEETADHIGKYVGLNDDLQKMLELLQSDETLSTNTSIKANRNNASGQIGSIAAGGRYDRLVGMFVKRPVPCISVSFSVDGIFSVSKSKARSEKMTSAIACDIDVYVMAFGNSDSDGLLLERMAIARQLRKAGIRVQYLAKIKAKFPQQFEAAKSVPL